MKTTQPQILIHLPMTQGLTAQQNYLQQKTLRQNTHRHLHIRLQQEQGLNLIIITVFYNKHHVGQNTIYPKLPCKILLIFRIAKLLRQSFRRSVRRIQNVLGPEIVQPPRPPPPDYASVLVEMNLNRSDCRENMSPSSGANTFTAAGKISKKKHAQRLIIEVF